MLGLNAPDVVGILAQKYERTIVARVGRNHGRVPPNVVSWSLSFGGSHPCIRPTSYKRVLQGRAKGAIAACRVLCRMGKEKYRVVK